MLMHFILFEWSAQLRQVSTAPGPGLGGLPDDAAGTAVHPLIASMHAAADRKRSWGAAGGDGGDDDPEDGESIKKKIKMAAGRGTVDHVVIEDDDAKKGEELPPKSKASAGWKGESMPDAWRGRRGDFQEGDSPETTLENLKRWSTECMLACALEAGPPGGGCDSLMCMGGREGGEEEDSPCP